MHQIFAKGVYALVMMINGNVYVIDSGLSLYECRARETARLVCVHE